MSRTPTTDGVASLRKLLRKHRELVEEVAFLQKQSKRLLEADRERYDAEVAIHAALEEMDCASTGNFGWGERMRWLLDQLDRQAASRG